ncbi:MAG: hypothetical protein NVV72_11465 [Asticcacaulis sp.]|nr:hypothetical protein [Asticcacaulis sp.]
MLPRSARHDELEEVVRADRDEVDRLHQLVELPEQRRHFEHGAELQAGRQVVGEARQMPHLAVDDLARLRDLESTVTIGSITPQLAPAGGLQQRADLRAQQPRPVEGEGESRASRAPGSPPGARRFLK